MRRRPAPSHHPVEPRRDAAPRRRWRGRGLAITLAVGALVAPAVASADWTITLVSRSADGQAGNSDDVRAVVAPGGGAVAFQSRSTNLHPEDTDLDWDVYVADLATGETQLASIRADRKKRGHGGRGKKSTSSKGNHYSQEPSLSADGTLVAFQSQATNFDRADPHSRHDIYLKDLASGALTLVSANSDGVVGDGYSFRPSLSADGRLVAFETSSTNLHPDDPDTVRDIVVKDLDTSTYRLASTSSTGVKGNGTSYDAALSADGTAVTFSSLSTNLDPADPDADPDVYHKDLVTGELTLVSAVEGRSGTGSSYAPSISGDGQRVAFLSKDTTLHPDDVDASEDAYLAEVATGALRLVSTTADGVVADNLVLDVALSGDGSTATFSTIARNLDPADDDFYVSDVYTKDLASGALTLETVGPDGNKADQSSGGPTLSTDAGTLAFISSATNLDPTTTPERRDVFAAHRTVGVD